MEGSPRHRGPPRRGHAHLGELGDSDYGCSSLPRRATPHLSRDELCLGMPACVWGLCLWPVWGRFRGPIYDCYGSL